MPGEAQAQREFWYQAFHNLELSIQLVDGQPGAFAASIAWYRSGAGSVAASLGEFAAAVVAAARTRPD
jgi:hypothetical protein